MGHERSARQQEELKFAKEVAQVLDDTVDAKISKVYLIAPARFLGLLRPAISANVRQHVAAELDRDLVNLTPEKVREHLPEYL
jgi:protein required for attachment to host cells